MSRPIRFAISTCPNDTFAFHAFLNRSVDWRGLDFDIELLDIQTLNERLLEGSLDVAKTSYHAALHLADRYAVFDSGSALGFGVGPLLLASRPNTKPDSQLQLTLCPGRDTTASLLFNLFYPHTTRINQVVFSEIMPRLKQFTADFGVCIHEGRFTWEQEGLHLVEDLGTRWESETNTPLPLGGLIGSKELGMDRLQTIQQIIYDSIAYARSQPSAALPTMRLYAQEFDDEVLMQHVDLYVNDWTVSLGELGEQALAELADRAVGSGLIAQAKTFEIIRARQ